MVGIHVLAMKVPILDELHATLTNHGIASLSGEYRGLEGDLVAWAAKACRTTNAGLRDALVAADVAINPPDLSGISLAEWNGRLKAATAVIRAALGIATSPDAEIQSQESGLKTNGASESSSVLVGSLPHETPETKRDPGEKA